MLKPFDFPGRPRVVYGPGRLNELGPLAKELGFKKTLLCADRGLAASPHVERAIASLHDCGIQVSVFSEFGENPDDVMAERGRAFAVDHHVDSLVGFGGGSSMDCAKAISFLVSNGGRMQDYWGYDKATTPLLPMIGVPTTAGTGSEAQSYALISDSDTHVKMACGAPSASFKLALLDPELTLTLPESVTALAGYDALAHSVETYVTTKRNPRSDNYAGQAFRLIVANFEKVLTAPDDLTSRAAMQLGAFYAGTAIELSMLGAAHACANPLTQRYGCSHGRAIGHLLGSVVRFNANSVADRYVQLCRMASMEVPPSNSAKALAARLEEIALGAGLKTRLRDAQIPETDLPELAERAAEQWTGSFNPKHFNASAALEIYQAAY